MHNMSLGCVYIDVATYCVVGIVLVVQVNKSKDASYHQLLKYDRVIDTLITLTADPPPLHQIYLQIIIVTLCGSLVARPIKNYTILVQIFKDVNSTNFVDETCLAKI